MSFSTRKNTAGLRPLFAGRTFGTSFLLREAPATTSTSFLSPDTARVALLSDQAAHFVDKEEWIEAEQALSSLLQLCGIKTGILTDVEKQIKQQEAQRIEEQKIQEERVKAEAIKEGNTSRGGSKSTFSSRDIVRRASTRLEADELKKKMEAEQERKEQEWVPLLSEEQQKQMHSQLETMCAQDTEAFLKRQLQLPEGYAGGGGAEESLVRAFIGRQLYLLAFSQQSMGKRHLAETHYRRALVCFQAAQLGEYSSEAALARLNFAELLASLNKILESERVAREAAPVISQHFGEDSELHGALAHHGVKPTQRAILSNLGGYMCAQHKYEEAKQVCFTALEILYKALGGDNELTQSALQNCMAILQKTDKEALEEFKKEWSGKGNTGFKGKPEQVVSEKEVNEAVDQFKSKMEAKALDPRGWMKDFSFSKEEMKEFMETQEDVDPDMVGMLSREVEAINRRYKEQDQGVEDHLEKATEPEEEEPQEQEEMGGVTRARLEQLEHHAEQDELTPQEKVRADQFHKKQHFAVLSQFEKEVEEGSQEKSTGVAAKRHHEDPKEKGHPARN